MARRGYWGDIVNSPYLTFGLESENKDLFCKANTKHTKAINTYPHFLHYLPQPTLPLMYKSFIIYVNVQVTFVVPTYTYILCMCT